MQNRSVQRWDKRSLRILALSVLIVLIFSLGCLLTYQKLRDERQVEDRAEAQRMLLAFEAHSTRLFDYADGQLRAIRAHLDEHDNNTEKLASFIHKIKAKHAEIFADITTVIDRDGWIVYQSGTPRDKLKALGKMPDLDHYHYFITHPGDSLFVGATRQGRVTSKMQYRLARPIFKNGVFDGAVVLSLLPEYITNFYRSTRLGPHSFTSMFTLEQWLIVRQPDVSPKMYGNRITKLLRPERGHGSSAFGFTGPFDQIQRDVFAKTLADYPVILAVGIAGQDRYDTLAAARRNLSLLAAAFTMFSMFACFLILRLLSQKSCLLSQNRQLAISETVSRQSLSELHRLSDHIQTVREDERKRIAQDIHDDLGQNLLVLKMDATTLCSGTEGTNPNLNQRVSLMLNNINSTIQSIKLIMNNLRPATLELGLLAAVEWQLKQFMRSSGIDCKLVTSEETELDFDKNKSLALFRIFQEALSNIVRHAQATKVKVKLYRDEHGFSMMVKDNGKGIESGDREKSNSFGLIGIKERAYAIGAEFAIESTGNGTTLSIFIAMEKNSTLEIIRPTIRSLTPDATTV
jgi:signal transduction histidine kinase